MPLVWSYGVGEYVAAEAHYAVMPKNWKRDGSRRGVIYCGGYQSTATALVDPLYSGIPNALAEAGIPVMTCDFSANDDWGQDVAITRMGQAWTFFKSRFGVATDKVVLLGGSMGALTSLNWAAANVTTVAAWVGLIPAVNLADIHDNNRGGYATAIETAYGGAAAYAAAVATHNPAASMGTFTFPGKIWHSSDDTIVVPSAVTTFASGTGMTAVSVGPRGHAVTGLDPYDVFSFVRQYA